MRHKSKGPWFGWMAVGTKSKRPWTQPWVHLTKRKPRYIERSGFVAVRVKITTEKGGGQ